ncbi:MAG: hypothetical protein KC457_13415 [Myxococcales bacterium]|nr:hypothetical protein [Myxococcales bacterium]
MSRLLLLEQADVRLAVDEQVVERVDLLAGDILGDGTDLESGAVPSLLPLLGMAPAELDSHGRVLTLLGGHRLRVPAAMQLIDNVEVLHLPEILRSTAARVGVIGLVELEGEPTLVCDPRLLLQSQDETLP